MPLGLCLNCGAYLRDVCQEGQYLFSLFYVNTMTYTHCAVINLENEILNIDAVIIGIKGFNDFVFAVVLA